MKSLVGFSSRTGMTQRVGTEIAEALQSDVEELLDVKKTDGLLGFLRSGSEARNKKLTELQPTKFDPSGYDLVILGTLSGQAIYRAQFERISLTFSTPSNTLDSFIREAAHRISALLKRCSSYVERLHGQP